MIVRVAAAFQDYQLQRLISWCGLELDKNHPSPVQMQGAYLQFELLYFSIGSLQKCQASKLVDLHLHAQLHCCGE